MSSIVYFQQTDESRETYIRSVAACSRCVWDSIDVSRARDKRQPCNPWARDVIAWLIWAKHAVA